MSSKKLYNTDYELHASVKMLFPYISNIVPNSGSVSGGLSVTINGQNFTDVNTVKFGGTNATSFTLVNSNQLIARTPAYSHTGIVDVTIISPFGTATAHGGFTYI